MPHHKFIIPSVVITELKSTHILYPFISVSIWFSLFYFELDIWFAFKVAVWIMYSQINREPYRSSLWTFFRMSLIQKYLTCCQFDVILQSNLAQKKTILHFLISLCFENTIPKGINICQLETCGWGSLLISLYQSL